MKRIHQKLAAAHRLHSKRKGDRYEYDSGYYCTGTGDRIWRICDQLSLFKKETGKDIEPTDKDILKYVLWEEQNHICLYTGKQIRISDFIGANPKFDIEHTIPRSVGGDSTKMNLTLCDSRFNRDVKKTKLPVDLSNHDEIMERINEWKKKYELLDMQIRKLKKLSKGATTKEQKDTIIRKRHLLELRRDYWRGKYERFTMESVPEGFSRRQGTDISVISKYARLYLKSLFNRVYTVKGIATSDFRKIWGIQDIYSKKERVNHVHHCIDAIVIACIGLDEYNKLGAYYHDEENNKWYGMSKASFKKPWATFVEDIKKIQDEILVYHYTPDNMPKQGRRRIKIDGKKVLCKGDAARGSLHNDTYYGAIENDGAVKYVKRIDLASMKESDVKNIVDDTVRGIIEAAIKEKGFNDAMASTIWMNEEKRIPIKKVRCFTPSITKPLNIRKQRDVSTKEYKLQYHVANDSNYLLAMYIGTDNRGKEKREFEIVNMLQAAHSLTMYIFTRVFANKFRQFHPAYILTCRLMSATFQHQNPVSVLQTIQIRRTLQVSIEYTFHSRQQNRETRQRNTLRHNGIHHCENLRVRNNQIRLYSLFIQNIFQFCFFHHHAYAVLIQNLPYQLHLRQYQPTLRSRRINRSNQ